MKQVIRGLLAAPILALAALVCIAPATAGPPTKVTNEKVMQTDNARLNVAMAPTTGSETTLVMLNAVTDKAGKLPAENPVVSVATRMALTTAEYLAEEGGGVARAADTLPATTSAFVITANAAFDTQALACSTAPPTTNNTS